MRFHLRTALGCLVSMWVSSTALEAGALTWPAPEQEALSEHYTVTVDDRTIPVYACRVSAVPFNQVWPGYQRPLDQTEPAAFACWDMTDSVQVVIESQRPVQSIVVRPASLGIHPTLEGNRISFSLERPSPVIVEVNGLHHALHLFAGAPETAPPAPDTPGVRYFGPGVHRAGRIELQSNETLYIAGGAVVYGSVHSTGASNLRIAGRGILDVSPFPRGEGGGAIRLTDCSDVTIEGIVMRDPDVWCCSLFGCRRVTIANVKLVGLWRYNADGIDVCNSQDVEVRDCFVRAFDDALVIKGLKFGRNSFDEQPVENVRFRRCVVWCDWGRAMEIGAETCAPHISNVVFEDCDIVRTTHIAMDIQHGDRALIRDIQFNRIRVEIDDQKPQPRMQTGRDERYPTETESRYCPTLMEIVIRKNPYSKDEERGRVENVTFADITVIGSEVPQSSLRGFDAEHGVDGVIIRNLRFNDRLVQNAADARLQIGPHVGSVRFTSATDEPSSGDASRRIPLLYGTDLFHPHEDPDDHFDLATLYALPGFDLRGIVLDQGNRQMSSPGSIPVAQLNALTGRRIPTAIGLPSKLQSPSDAGLDQPEAFQGGVRMILDTLRTAAQRVDIITVGSVRDLVAAFNRDPELFRERAGRVMVFIGEASDPGFQEYNVSLDPHAYVGLMRSGLNLYWVPCFDGGLWRNEGHASFWQARHADLLQSAPSALVQFFIYALEKEAADPLAFIREPVNPARRQVLFEQRRNLWCAAVFRSLTQPGDPTGEGFTFETVEVAVTDEAALTSSTEFPSRTVRRFQVRNPEQYAAVMTQATAEILAQFPIARP